MPLFYLTRTLFTNIDDLYHKMAELEETDSALEPCRLDKDEFHEAFKVFGDVEKGQMSTANSVIVPFLKSLGISDAKDLYAQIKGNGSHDHNMIMEDALKAIVMAHVETLSATWPSDRDVVEAFRVFDAEGLGFIKVTLLKRFLGQAQLDVDDTVLESLIRDNCQIDGDDLINYEDFVRSISDKYHSLPSTEEADS